MSPYRRSRLSVFAAALSGTLVLVMAGAALAAEEDLDCSDFDYQEEAQAVLHADPSDPHRLVGGTDSPADEVACEPLPSRGADDDAGESDDEADAPATTPAAAPDHQESADGGDRDRPDLATRGW